MAGEQPRVSAANAKAAALLRQWGPTVEVKVMNHRRGSSRAPPVEGRAIIDTGSSTTAISFETAARLRLDPVGKMQIGTGTDVVRAPTFAVSIEFPGGVVIDFDAAPGLPIAQAGQVAIIGRDVLSRALFDYNGPAGTASLRFAE